MAENILTMPWNDAGKRVYGPLNFPDRLWLSGSVPRCVEGFFSVMYPSETVRRI